jgi:REP element-mobilizing transposase RayT
MKYNPEEHHRRSIRLKEYDYSETNWYYVTICSYERKNIFGEIKNSKMILNDYGKIVDDEWLKTKELRKNVDLDDYVIMPNHFQGILIIERRGMMHHTPTDAKYGKPISGSLSVIIGSFKASVTRRINKRIHPNMIEVWQRDFYEHIIRNENDLYNIRKYIELNPLQWEIDEYYKTT